MAATKVTAGVDLGGTKIQTAVLLGETVVGSARVLTPRTGAAEDVIDAITGTIRAALEQAAADTQISLRAIGIGSPGEIDAAQGIVSRATNVPGFGGRTELGPLVSGAMGGVPVSLGNDVRVGVLGEFHRGAGRPYKNLLGVWVGTGVGGGLILGGELYNGRGAAGEIGHMVAKPNGRRCGCGRRGCLEAYAGRMSMERRARKLVKGGEKTLLFKIMEEQERERLTSGVFARALDKNDAMAKGLIDDAIEALGVTIASAQNLTDLEAVIVGGGLGDRLGRPFVNRIVQQMTPHLFVPDQAPAMLTTELGDLAGAVGAAVLAGG